MPVDKFGRMSETKTEDTGVSITYINNNYVRSDGQTPLTGSLDMRGNTIYNVADPVNPQDVVTKVYVDNTKGSGVIGRKTKDGVSIRETMDFLEKQRIKNLPAPIDGKDAVNREYVDSLAINHPFEFIDNTYQAKADLDLKGNKIKNLCSPFDDGDAATKGYLDTQSAAFLKVDQGIYEAKADINLDKIYTVYNVKAPIDEGHVTDKKYVDDQINFNSAFSKKNGGYEAKGHIYLRRNKILGLREPEQPGEPTTKKYVDNIYNNLFNQYVDVDDNIISGKNVDMEGNQVLNLPEPAADHEPATKRYVDDLQTQHVDQKGNIKFGRNVNLDNKRIFAMKEPRKANEGANKKYVDDTINKRIQEEKDNFLPQDAATKNYVDEAIRGIAAGDVLVSKEGVFIKENGHYRATALLDIDNQKMENVPDPVDEKDAVNKKYIDETFKELTLKQGLIRENGGFNLVDSYINMNFNNIKNVGLPKHTEDAVPRSFVDGEIRALKEQINKRKQLITATASFHGDLIKGKYQFTFGGSSNPTYDKHDVFNGFLMSHSGYIKRFVLENFGVKFDTKLLTNFQNVPIPLFTLVLIKNESINIIELGTFNIIFKYDSLGDLKTVYSFISNVGDLKKYQLFKKDIINVRTEYNTYKGPNSYAFNERGYSIGDKTANEFYVNLVSVLIELDPLEDEDN